MMREIVKGIYIGETYSHYVHCNKCAELRWCIAFYDKTKTKKLPYGFLCEKCFKEILKSRLQNG